MEEAAASLRIRPRVAARITFHVHLHPFRSMVRLTARKRTWGPMRGAGARAGLRRGMHFICPFVHSVDRPAAQRDGQVPVHVSSRRGSGQALWRQNAAYLNDRKEWWMCMCVYVSTAPPAVVVDRGKCEREERERTSDPNRIRTGMVRSRCS